MYLADREDVEAFTRDLGGEVTFTRLAVTPEQIATYDLPRAAQDNRPARIRRSDLPSRSPRSRPARRNPAHGNRGTHRPPRP